MAGYGMAKRGGIAAAACLLFAACGQNPGQSGSAADAERLAALDARLDALETQVVRNEDSAAIRRLMRTYSYYLDRGLWADLTELMTDDARGSYPAGVFIGRESLAPHFMLNNGRGHLGFEHGRLGNHIAFQPVITVDPDGETAHGRWRVLAQLGQYGQSASWAAGLYEIDYRKEADVWRISDLRYYGTFSAPFEGGWANIPPPPASPGAAMFRNLPHPADEPAETDCPPLTAGVCVPPFHYPNPGSGRVWTGLDALSLEGGAQ